MMPYFEFLEKLRKTTSQYHEQLEKSPISVQLLSPTVTGNDYINYLLASYRLHTPVEEELFPMLQGTIDDIGERKKSPAIKADLLEFGESNLPYSTFLEDSSTTPAFGLGIMYVLEGSTLGGLHIVKAIQQNLGAGAPKHFLTVYGNNTGQRWKHFLQLLDNFTQHNTGVQDDIIEGALFAFKKAHHFFNDSYATNKL